LIKENTFGRKLRNEEKGKEYEALSKQSGLEPKLSRESRSVGRKKGKGRDNIIRGKSKDDERKRWE